MSAQHPAPLTPREGPEPRAHVLPNTAVLKVGAWYWVEREDARWLGCVMRIGSNFADLEGPGNARRTLSTRIHLEQAGELLMPEPDAARIIKERIGDYQRQINAQLEEVRRITAALGLGPQDALERAPDDAPGQALAVLSSQTDIRRHAQALEKAKEVTLPALFAEIGALNETMALWMQAEALPLKAQTQGFQAHIDQIEDRIFNVSLYAGLTESVVQCCAGTPAGMHEKLHVMQRRLYMDEECLLGYRLGGMSFEHIADFDAWLCEPENRDRILPFARCITAMRVRRHEKYREGDGTLRTSLIQIELAELDKSTFLYIRNGEQVYRLTCDLDFDELIFPDHTVFSDAEPLMFEVFAGRVSKFMTRREYEDRVATRDRLLAERKAWESANPRRQWEARNPGRSYHFAGPQVDRFDRLDAWEPFDPSSLYYDEAARVVAAQIKLHNRIALIIQGLFDRSDVLHPHPPVKIWTPEGFAAAVELVYDGTRTLGHGEKPDFEAYRARLNASIGKNCVLAGQEDYWERKEAEKESRRMDADMRIKGEWRPTRHRPYGNPGPGTLARARSWQPKKRSAVFSWYRERQTYDWNNEPVRATITVPADELLNVSAYTPGDYRQFFEDPRTRQEYLKWAPLLLLAEEYHAGNLEAQDPVPSKGG
ncbi:hypothetical protein [Thioalkalivibrio thiocyanodenitrificans]|uniref:hypothetical protein n=1 Tax=Thioalkalivibrio thiocyanodenitrificans TaxID=243063 RepID=UPI0003795215|nr:hypothetical protein [Thioalkalivibrio thiocyanodenitrificans]